MGADELFWEQVMGLRKIHCPIDLHEIRVHPDSDPDRSRVYKRTGGVLGPTKIPRPAALRC